MTDIRTFANIWKPRLLLSVLVAAFVLSYAALFQQATAAGYHWGLAWLWPLLVDGLVLFAVISLAERQTRGLSTGFVWFVLIVFDVASIILNASYGLEISWQAALVHAAPATVAPLVLKLFCNDIKDAEAAKLAANEAAKAAKASKRITAFDGKSAQFGPQNLTAANESRQQKIDARRAKIRELLADDPQLSNADLAGLLGCSPDTVRRDLEAIEAEPVRVLTLNGRGH